jgi:hypothetical protein
MIFALACGFSNLHWLQLILNDNKRKKKERAELGFEPRTSYNLGIRPKARTANVRIITSKNN